MNTRAMLMLGLMMMVAGPMAEAQEVNWNDRAPWFTSRTVERGDWDTYRKEPFRIFDNVHYVGLQNVSSYLITTPEGLVLVDATYPETADLVLENIRSLGYDPSEVEYIFITHGHGDHYGGAARLKEATGARIGMSAADWDLVEERAAEGGPQLERDLVIEDRQVITLGGHAFKFYVTPGHTPGSLTMEYMAYSPVMAVRAMTPGGLGFNFGPEGTRPYIESLERIRSLRPALILANHPHMGPTDLFTVEDKTDAERFRMLVSTAKVDAWLDSLEDVARQKLGSELAADDEG